MPKPKQPYAWLPPNPFATAQVRPTGIDKGVMVDHIISLLHSNSGGVDFVLCIGDDSVRHAPPRVPPQRHTSTPP